MSECIALCIVQFFNIAFCEFCILHCSIFQQSIVHLFRKRQRIGFVKRISIGIVQSIVIGIGRIHFFGFSNVLLIRKRCEHRFHQRNRNILLQMSVRLFVPFPLSNFLCKVLSLRVFLFPLSGSFLFLMSV